MFRTRNMAIAALLAVGFASAAQAASENQSDPTRGATTGPEGQKQGGSAVNPADHKSTRHAARHHTKKPATSQN
jgi:opacity protein-like surface antigen